MPQDQSKQSGRCYSENVLSQKTGASGRGVRDLNEAYLTEILFWERKNYRAVPWSNSVGAEANLIPSPFYEKVMSPLGNREPTSEKKFSL